MEQSSFVRKLIRKVSEDQPSGVCMREDDVFYDLVDHAKELRKEIYEGVVKRNPRFDQQKIKECIGRLERMFRTKTKDIQIAAWILYFWTIERGTDGLRDGFVLLDFMVNNYWDSFHPMDDEEGRANVIAWINDKVAIEVLATMKIMDTRLFEIEEKANFDVHDPSILAKTEEISLTKSLSVVASLEDGFNKKSSEKVSLSDMRSAIRKVITINKNIQKTIVVEATDQEIRQAAGLMEEKEGEEDEDKNRQVKNIVLREKLYDELEGLADKLLKLNAKDIIALIIKDAITKLRNREVVDLLQLLVNDQVYLNYVQRLIKR